MRRLRSSQTLNKVQTLNNVSDSCFFPLVAEQLIALNSSSGASVQQGVGSNPGRDTCVLEQDT